MQPRVENRVICSHCGYKWYKRTENPLQCPKCTSRLWSKSKPSNNISDGLKDIDANINKELKSLDNMAKFEEDF